ncbi:major capsid protein VP1 [Gokushovirinae Fen672_31]|uniref:major capsid protein VP1 n=1 Tax=Gokushovirinae Fen672_31 TaxID=1655656 RepID=UPI00063D5853|nr:major capsid protein VP1 [Gokushovirinae Fen672_31]AKI26919.1 major capsid protein VP1 [Gokushovirinae Fen672_31]
MSHMFSQVPKASIPRSTFDRSHGMKATFDSGYLIPIYVDEALPGDTFNLSLTTFARLSTPLHPVMDNMKADVFFSLSRIGLFGRIFVNFLVEQANPTDSTSFLVPTCTSPSGPGYVNESLQDYMGIPTAVVNLTHDNLFPRAYNLIWNQWFRDQNLQNSVVVDMGDGPDNPANYVLLRRGKRHDYFTASLPWPQKGPSVSIPLGGTAPVIGIGGSGAASALPGSTYFQTDGTTLSGAGVVASTVNEVAIRATAAGAFSASNPPQIFANLATATAATINQLRQAFQIQKIYERDARGGTRYTELIQAHFGVTSPDARLQRAEYLGGGSTPINVNPIAQTQGTGASGTTTPQGNLAAIGTMSHRGVGFTKSFTEHCLLIGLLEVTADLSYQQGLERMWSRQTRFDFFWPALAQIGEQAVLNQEICMVGGATDTQIWGYQERYAEYRYKPSRICGQFRSSYTAPLDSWHLSQYFTTLPALNSTFIQDAPPISRIVAVPSQPQFLLDCYFNLKCSRPMPVYGVPGNIDRF